MDERRTRVFGRIAAVEAIAVVGLVIVLLLRDAPATDVAVPRSLKIDERAAPSAVDVSRGPESHAVRSARAPEPRAAPTSALKSLTPRADDDGPAAPDDPLGIFVYGMVKTEDGRCVKVQHLDFSGIEAEFGDDRDARETAYTVVGLHAGQYRVTIRGAGFQDTEKSVELAASPARRRLDFVVAAAHVMRIKVLTPEGEPFTAALRRHMQEDAAANPQAPRFDVERSLGAAAWKSGLPDRLPPTRDYAVDVYGAGRYRSLLAMTDRNVDPGVIGVLETYGPFPLWVALTSRSAILEVREFAAAADEAVFTLTWDALTPKLAKLKLRVVDADTGAPIVGAKVALNDPSSWRQGMPVDAQGNWSADDVPPGWSHVSVNASGYADPNREVRLDPGATLDLGDVRLLRAALVWGRVVGADPADGRIDVAAALLDGVASAAVSPEWRAASVNSGEMFRLDAPRARLVLRATTFNGRIVTRVVDASAGDVGDVELAFAAATPVDLRVKPKAGGSLLMSIVAPDGVPVVARRVSWGGVFHYRLAPGTYAVHVVDDDGVAKDFSIVVGDEPVTAEIGP